ncbi:MAG TPA: hypothetical protein VLH75_08155 [Longimicrobiales bacterium]|nr:hypothetical protein [Longimicrobiales bacterium]
MCTKKSLRPSAFLLASLLAAVALHAPAAAQGVTYVTVTKPEMGGAMGMVARMAPGATAERKVATYIQGDLQRTDEDEATSIINDMGAGRFTYLDHKEKTYYSMTLAEMMAQAQAAMGGMAGAEPAEGTLELKVERTGKTQSFDGYTAEQLLMYTEPTTGADAQVTEGGPAGMAFLVELWFSKDFPGYAELKKAQDAMGASAAAGMEGGFAADPAMMEAGRKIAEQMKGIEGIPVRTVTSFVMVPPGAEFDREAVLAASDKPLGSGGGGAAAAAAGAARQALGGLMGRRRQQEQPAPDAAPTQSVYMRVTQIVQDVKTGAIPGERFQVPAGYREVTPGR